MRILLLCLLVALFDVPSRGESRVSLKNRGRAVGYAPLTARLQISVLPDVKNRLLCIEWSSSTQYGKGCHQLDGGDSPKTIWRDVELRHSGEYEIVAWVLQNDETVIRSNTETVKVLGF